MEITNINNEIKNELYAIKSNIVGILNTIESNKSFDTQLSSELTSISATDTTDVSADDNSTTVAKNESNSEILKTLTEYLTNGELSLGEGENNNIIIANNVYQTYNSLDSQKESADETKVIEAVNNESPKEIKKVVESDLAKETNKATETTSNINSTDSAQSTSTLKTSSLDSQINELKSASLKRVTPEIRLAVTKAAEKYNVPEKLILKVIETESDFNGATVSSSGAVGLMQLMPETAKYLGVSNSKNTEQNINGGTKYLRQMLDKYNNNLTLALAAYNAGPGNVNKYNGVPPFKETQNYVKKILN